MDSETTIPAADVKRYRESMNLTRRELAEVLGISVHQLASIENDRRQCKGPLAKLLVVHVEAAGITTGGQNGE